MLNVKTMLIGFNMMHCDELDRRHVQGRPEGVRSFSLSCQVKNQWTISTKGQLVNPGLPGNMYLCECSAQVTTDCSINSYQI